MKNILLFLLVIIAAAGLAYALVLVYLARLV